MLIVAASLIAITGCNETYVQKKQEIQTHWETSTALAKLPMVEDLITRGDLKQAKEILNNCLAAAPENPKVHLLVGRIHFIEGRSDKARQSFQKMVDLDPQLDAGWYSLGTLAIMEKNYSTAMEYCQKALQLQPDNTNYIISVSELFVEMEQLDSAKEVVQAALEKQSNNMELILEMARLCQRSDQTSDAIRLYEQAQLLHGSAPQILEPCAYAYMKQGQWARAAEKFELLLEQIKQNPEHYNVTLRSLAICSFNAENYGRALSCYDKLSNLYRDDPEIWLGMAQSALGLNDTNRAVRCAEKTLQLQPSFARAYVVLASALYMKGDYQKALNAFDKIAANDEFAAFAWFMSGRCYRQMGQTVQAEAAFERAEQLDPDNELIRMFLKKTLKFL